MRFAAQLVGALLLSATTAVAQESTMNAGALAHALDRVAQCARVLYVGAHPDDENTRLLSYLANDRHVTVAYLSMTRGGGGQNLLGREQDELLDVIRTEELLAARRIDGAVQRFTRMRDFGYSKTAAETLAIWDHDQALADVVRVIRSFQPDVIITRFNELPPNHGHHTASAILAREAFAAAADPAYRLPALDGGAEQADLAPWQTTRLLNNVPTWTDTPPPADALQLDVGSYDARLGMGYAELAARSRSQHKSQGFGVAGERGPIVERFVVLAGSPTSGDILEGIEPGWQRFGDQTVSLTNALAAARRTLERDRPELALPGLIEARQALRALPNSARSIDARAAIDRVIVAVLGLFVRATSTAPFVTPGGSVPVRVEIALRRPADISLLGVRLGDTALVTEPTRLELNQKREFSGTMQVAADAPISAPYWLAQPPLAGRQRVTDAQLIGAPKGPAAATVGIQLTVSGETIELSLPVVYAWTDPVEGERERQLAVVPPATITPLRNAVMFANFRPAKVVLRVHAGRDQLNAKLSLPLPEQWRVEPTEAAVALARAGDEANITFTVTPPAGAAPIEIQPRLEADGKQWSYREDVIDYPHIPVQVVLQPARLRLAPLQLQLPKGRVGYIAGSGDTVAEDLAHVGVPIEILDEQMVRSGALDRFAAIVVGIRAYNTNRWLATAHERLMEFVRQGGTLVVQYNTNNRLAPLTVPVGPYPLEIGRERVTQENAAMQPVDPKDSVLTTPNRIEDGDFAGWVQERGLYYAAQWDPQYRAIFSAADDGEQPLRGGLLVARHGRGRYVYTGLAFFRQLPAGVTGAYRLFANLLAAERP